MVLLDFVTTNFECAQVTAKEIVDRTNAPYALLVYSGRSFHLYSFSFYKKSDWISLMGTCLLYNKKNQEKIVDDRWIGYRLISGYGALRLTCNNKNYLSEPYVVEVFQ